ncbi:unnamed protein product [Cochlearia groenlandica]
MEPSPDKYNSYIESNEFDFEIHETEEDLELEEGAMVAHEEEEEFSLASIDNDDDDDGDELFEVYVQVEDYDLLSGEMVDEDDENVNMKSPPTSKKVVDSLPVAEITSHELRNGTLFARSVQTNL